MIEVATDDFTNAMLYTLRITIYYENYFDLKGFLQYPTMTKDFYIEIIDYCQPTSIQMTSFDPEELVFTIGADT